MKETQNYSNHVRSYPLHHFVFYPIVIMSAVACGTFVFTRADDSLLWLALAGLFLMLALESFMMRQHYALTSQNRTIRLELRLRYYILAQKRFEEVEKALSPGQLYALRFASDEEFLGLVDRVLRENLSANDIKKAITQWQADHMRV